MTVTPTNTTLLRGSNVSLNCSTDANPDAHMYQFYFNVAYIGNSSSGIFNVTVDADGVYTCVPINIVGTRHNASVSFTAVGKLVKYYTSLNCLPFVLPLINNLPVQQTDCSN